MSDARILIVDDEANIRELLDEILSEEGYDVTTAEDAAHAREARRGRDFDLTLLDIWMPDTDGISLLKEWADSGSLGPVVMMSGHGSVDTAVEATRLGALDFIEKPVSLSQLLRTVSKALSGRQPARGTQSMAGHSQRLVGKSQRMRELREKVQAAARHETNLLFSGEHGSGRALSARLVAGLSSRAGQRFETVDCAALQDEDALDRVVGNGNDSGALARAVGGVLCLRGLDEMPPSVQVSLAEALARSAGPDAGDSSALRVFATVAPGLERDGQFVPKLARIVGSVVIRVPALRDHAEDVPELLRYFVGSFVERERLPFRRFSIAAQNRLRNYPWPGNVGELKHLVKQMLVLGADDDIGLAEVEAELAAESADSGPLIKQDLLAMPLREAREHFERAYLRQQLQLCGGKVGQLAKRVGMERTHLYRKLRALGVDFRQAAQDD
ncbi:MAG TPA: sigma-54 dependent transcriptional regulator [Gammaproteobacteria bacterium]